MISDDNMRCFAVALIVLCWVGSAACGGPPLLGDRGRDRNRARDRAGGTGHSDKTGSESLRPVAEGDDVSGQGKQWGGWRYSGSRDACFFVVGRRCFSSEAKACAAATCGTKSCVADGGGPATIRCH
jgi:hypothetical protein